MIKEIPKSFSGVLRYDTDIGICWPFFHVSENLITLIPDSSECRKAFVTTESTNKNESAEESNDNCAGRRDWLFGFTQNGYSVAFCKPNNFNFFITSPVNLGTATFRTPIILQTTVPEDVDLHTFDAIEFRGGIVDLLHLSGRAVVENYEEKRIDFCDEETFTACYTVNVDGEVFDVTYTVDVRYISDSGKVPDLRNNICSVLRFNFSVERLVQEFVKYYNYALQLFRFCTRHMNLGFEVRLYRSIDGNVKTILTKIKDGYDDYANHLLNLNKVIRFEFLGTKFPQLFKLLNEETTAPSLLFLPKRNSESGYVFYTNVTDICVALEREFDLSENELTGPLKDQAMDLAKELNTIIDKSKYDIAVKNKAKGLINGNLPDFKPSLRQKMVTLYDEFTTPMKCITEPKLHVECGIAKTYTDKEFKTLMNKFIKIRNSSAHSGVVWNEGIEIYVNLQLLVYFNILKRAGYTVDESQMVLSFLFGHMF